MERVLDPRRQTVKTNVRRRSGLPPWKLRRVTEHIEARLADAIKYMNSPNLASSPKPNLCACSAD